MPCYVNPEVAKVERDLCEQRWLYLTQMRDLMRRGVELTATEMLNYYNVYKAQLQHRKEDRDFLIEHIAVKGTAADLQKATADLMAMSDDELVFSYWRDWEDEQFAQRFYRGRDMNCPRDPHAPRVAASPF